MAGHMGCTIVKNLRFVICVSCRVAMKKPHPAAEVYGQANETASKAVVPKVKNYILYILSSRNHFQPIVY